MTNQIATAITDWRLTQEPGAELYRLRGTDSLRDRPIELTITAAELVSLADFLGTVVASAPDVFGEVQVTRIG